MYQSEPKVISNATLREEVVSRIHESGLPVFFCNKPGYQKRYACFATHFGSIDSSFRRRGSDVIEVPDGTAHFLEHKLFEGPEANAFEEFSRNGASPNAYTSSGATNYLFSCNENFFDNLKHLVRFVQKPWFTEENVEKEKGIIGQEIRMYEDDPGWRMYINLLEALYHEHPVKKDILGTVESISGITPALLDSCYQTFYHPENMVLFGIGDEQPERFFEAADEALLERPQEPLGKLERFFPEEPQEVAEKQTSAQMAVSMPRFLIGFKDVHPGLLGRELLESELVTDILLEIIFGQSGEFFSRLYEQDLIDDNFSGSYSCMQDIGHSIIGGESRAPGEVEEAVLEELRRVRSSGIDGTDFERQKRAVFGGFMRQFNSLEFIANNYCGYRFLGVDIFEIIDVLQGITLEDLTRRLETHLDPERSTISVVVPR
ncbi:MAG TPA: insulinase family protein [Planctomycetes bacterium]|nr:insulinase family protein [Planctomycetota bacterium]